jgi:hypothetical protein
MSVSIEDRNKKIELANLQYEEDFKKVLESNEGFRWFKRFFSEAKILRNTFTGNSQSYYNDGQREMALRYFKDAARVAPKRFVEMQMELLTEE